MTSERMLPGAALLRKNGKTEELRVRVEQAIKDNPGATRLQLARILWPKSKKYPRHMDTLSKLLDR